jgi:hypothetical protein
METCKRCRRTVEWQTVAGSRVFRADASGRRVYATRCGCGAVARSASGAPLATSRTEKRGRG